MRFSVSYDNKKESDLSPHDRFTEHPIPKYRPKGRRQSKYAASTLMQAVLIASCAKNTGRFLLLTAQTHTTTENYAMTRTYTTEEERVANEFALALLMPENDFKEQVRFNDNHDGTINTKAIAEYFHVPISMASLRGQRLGLFAHPF